MSKKIRKKTKLVFDVGINDADYTLRPTIGSSRVTCPYFQKWRNMLARVYSKSWLQKFPTYRNCTVYEEWLTFSNFKSWMEKQDWEGKHLDKDLLGDGTIYSPDTCCFISHGINNFIRDSARNTDGRPSGVTFLNTVDKFGAMTKDPFTGKYINLGRYNTAEEAHSAWKAKKHEIALKFAEMEQDCKIIEALLNRYR